MLRFGGVKQEANRDGEPQQSQPLDLDPEKRLPSPPAVRPPKDGLSISPTSTDIAIAADNAEPPVAYPEFSSPRSILLLFGSFAGMTASFGTMNTIGVFQAYISTHQLKAYTPGQVSWIFSVYIFLAFAGGVVVGGVFDRWGPRWAVLGGSVGVVGAVAGLGWCKEYWQFMLVFGVVGGLGTTLIFTPATAVVGHYFFVHRAAATGLAVTGGSVGGIMFPLLFDSLIPRIGFAWSARVMALICLILVIFANLLIRPRLIPKPSTSALPKFRIWANPVFALTSIGIYMAEWGLFIPLTYLPSYALANNIPPAMALKLLAVFNAASFFGRWVPGFVADQVGRFNMMIAMVAVCLASTMGIWFSAGGSVGKVVSFALIFGFASGSCISLTAVCVGQLCETEEYGRYYAASYMLVSFGTLTGIPIAGQILSVTHGDYKGLIAFTAACYTAGLAAFIAARVISVGWKLNAFF
ncbi:MAG: hypothetical protein M1839_007742 [Geoglossum umbratile]|nr:MAG: hypothetical protein M1839_007742 [Geoglossum umbratile]